MMAPAGVELEMLVSEPDALTTRPPPCDYVYQTCFSFVAPSGRIQRVRFIFFVT